MNHSERDTIGDCLCDLARILNEDGYESKIRKAVALETDEQKEEIVTMCNRVSKVLDGKSKALTNLDHRINTKKELRKKYKNQPLSKKDAIIYTGLPKSTFERKVSDPEIRIWKDGKPKFQMDDLDKIARLIIDSSESVLCINTFYYFDRKREGYLIFRGGEYYKIIEEQEKVVFLYIEKFDTTLRIDKNTFNFKFILKENLNF